MIAALLALLLALFAHLSPAPAPHGSDSAGIGLVHPTLASPAAPAAATVAPHQVDVDEPTCLAGEEWDGLRCVALQLPEETTGRQYDPAD